MEANEQKPRNPNNTKFMVIIIVLLLAVIALLAMLLIRHDREDLFGGEQERDVDPGLNIGYDDAVVITDQSTLQDAVNQMYKEAREPGIILSYSEHAYSNDGVNFTCSLNNAPENNYDMYIGLYLDNTFANELFLSKLIPPGMGFEQISLNQQFPVGDYQVVAVFTQVKEEDGRQSIRGQIPVTVTLHVT